MIPRLSMIAAVAENLAIGKNNELLWDIKDDMRHFRTLTTGHTVIMGENTYRSIGRPLPNRTNIILSDKLDFAVPGCTVAHSKEEALEVAKQYEKDEVFVIGGARVYHEFIDLADRLYITRVAGSFEADTFFPAYEEKFPRILSEEQASEGEYRFTYLTLEKN